MSTFSCRNLFISSSATLVRWSRSVCRALTWSSKNLHLVSKDSCFSTTVLLGLSKIQRVSEKILLEKKAELAFPLQLFQLVQYIFWTDRQTAWPLEPALPMTLSGDLSRGVGVPGPGFEDFLLHFRQRQQKMTAKADFPLFVQYAHRIEKASRKLARAYFQHLKIQSKFP